MYQCNLNVFVTSGKVTLSFYLKFKWSYYCFWKGWRRFLY